MNRVLKKLSRISAYLLLILFIMIMITGYRQTGHFTFIGRGLASSLHQVYLNVVFLLLFAFHAIVAVRNALIRNKIKGLYIDILLILSGIIFVGGFSYFSFY